MAITYSPPSISVTTQGAQSVVFAGPQPRTILLLGTAPQGPDYPVLCDASTGASLFGDPSAAASIGYTIPLAMRFAAAQRQPVAQTAIQFLVCRVGVTRASVWAQDSVPANAVQFSGIGKYAGSKGNNLQVVITIATGVVTNITVTDTATSTTLQTFTNSQYDLSTNQAIVNAINGANPLQSTASVVTAAAGAGLYVGTHAGPTYTLTLVGGTDGKTATGTDTTIAPLLTNSLWTTADYIVPLYDAKVVSAAVASHVNTEAPALNQFRKAVCGPVAGTLYSALAAGATTYGMTIGDRLVCMGHDSAYATSPITGLQMAYDGFYLAAAYAGLKAAGPIEETCTGFSISGFSSLSLPAGQTTPLTPAQMNTLAGGGFLVLEQPPQSPLLVRDAISTVAYVLASSGGINPFSQFNVRDIDDAVSTVVVGALASFKGRPSTPPAIMTNQMALAVMTGLSELGTTINGVNSVAVNYDPNTLAFNVNVSYVTRYPVLSINVTTSYTFAPLAA